MKAPLWQRVLYRLLRRPPPGYITINVTVTSPLLFDPYGPAAEELARAFATSLRPQGPGK